METKRNLSELNSDDLAEIRIALCELRQNYTHIYRREKNLSTDEPRFMRLMLQVYRDRIEHCDKLMDFFRRLES